MNEHSDTSFGGIMALEEDKGSTPLFAFRHFSKDGEILDSALPSVLDQKILLIIDGQQRLQTFYMGLMGSANSKTLFFNLYSQGDYEFEFCHSESDLPKSKHEDDLEIAMFWYPVSTLFFRRAKVGDGLIVVAATATETLSAPLPGQDETVFPEISLSIYTAIQPEIQLGTIT